MRGGVQASALMYLPMHMSICISPQIFLFCMNALLRSNNKSGRKTLSLNVNTHEHTTSISKYICIRNVRGSPCLFYPVLYSPLFK